jgi:hypothetical protein
MTQEASVSHGIKNTFSTKQFSDPRNSSKYFYTSRQIELKLTIRIIGNSRIRGLIDISEDSCERAGDIWSCGFRILPTKSQIKGENNRSMDFFLSLFLPSSTTILMEPSKR